MEQTLNGQEFDRNKIPGWLREISEGIKKVMKNESMPRYKYIVHATIGERAGQGFRMGARCFWDSECDNMATENFVNDTLFCTVIVFAVYLY
jgi:hypothetical protein